MPKDVSLMYDEIADYEQEYQRSVMAGQEVRQTVEPPHKQHWFLPRIWIVVLLANALWTIPALLYLVLYWRIWIYILGTLACIFYPLLFRSRPISPCCFDPQSFLQGYIF